MHGRILVLNESCQRKYWSRISNAIANTWGPGRAGGGEEMGELEVLNITCKELLFKVIQLL